MDRSHIVFNAMSLRPGGGLTVLLGLLKGLKSHSQHPFRTTVVCSWDETEQAIRQQGVADVVLQHCRNAGRLKRQAWNAVMLPRVIANAKPDLFFSINQFIPGVGCPQVVYHINLLRFLPIDPNAGLIHRCAEKLRNRSARQALQRADANVFESEYLQTCARQMHGIQSPNDRVIYIGLPDRLADATPDGLKSIETPTASAQIFSITNHNRHKDNPTLIRTLAELNSRMPEVDWKLKIAGGLFPELWEPFRELARSLGVENQIEWLGFVDQDDLTSHLKSSLCLISTSRVESFCMVALEAMGRGCPAVVADTSSMPESVGDAALLAPAGDAAAFSESVMKFYQSPQLRADYVRRGYGHIKKFRWDACGEQFGSLFRQLVAEK